MTSTAGMSPTLLAALSRRFILDSSAEVSESTRFCKSPRYGITKLPFPLTHVALGAGRKMRIRRLQRFKALKFTGPIQVFVSPPFRTPLLFP